MSRWRFVLRSLIHHWRIHLAVVLGVAAATAVLTGALLVGDSVRGSLRRIALDRLGRIDQIILCDRFFRAELATGLAAQLSPEKNGWETAVPAIFLQGTVELQRKAAPDAARNGDDSAPPADDQAATDRRRSVGTRAGQVTILGVDDAFWQLGDRYGGGERIRPGTLPKQNLRQIVLNRPLADAIGAEVGDEVVLRLPRVSDIPADSPMGRKTDTIRNLAQLEVIDIVPAEGLGRFSLSPSQQIPLVAYVHPTLLQDALQQSGRVNAVLVAVPAGNGGFVKPGRGDLAELLRPSLDDFGLRIKHVRSEFTDPDTGRSETVLDYFSLSSDRMLIPPEVDAAAEQAFAQHTAQPVYTYLANTIAKTAGAGDSATPAESGGDTSAGASKDAPAEDERDGETPTGDEQPASRPIPYSTIVALNSTEQLGPLYATTGTPLTDLDDDEIVLHSWAAEQLKATVGDRIAVTFFKPESTHGKVVERTETFRLAAIVPLTQPAHSYSGDDPAVYTERPRAVNDPDLTPEVPGVTDKEALDDWDPPFPFDPKRIKPADDLYWENYRTTPKAYVALSRGRELWGSRFGQTTSFRVPAAEGVTAESLGRALLDQLHRDHLTPGFTFLPVRQNAIRASSGATPFDFLFLGFSMFLIASALMLVSLLFRLGIEQRAEQIGTLLAVGLRRRGTSRLFAAEGGIVAAAGGLLGLGGGIAYAWLMLAGLKSWWIAAIVTPFVDFHYTEKSLAIGYLAGTITAIATFAWSIANLRRVSVVRLLGGQASKPPEYARRRRRLSAILAWGLLVIAGGLLAYASRQGGEAQALGFFGSGAALLTAGLLLSWWWLKTSAEVGGAGGFSRVVPLLQLAFRNAARNAGRSTLTIGLVAAASFLIVAISAFQLQPSQAGTGGYDWVAETAQPIYQDLSSRAGRDQLGIIGENEKLLSQSDVFGLRVQSGDDASCLNMFQARRPRVIGVTPAFVSHFDDPDQPRFAFAAPAGKAHRKANLWKRLDDPSEDGTVPVILDKNTAMYALHLYGGVGEEFTMVDDVSGRGIRFRIVALLADSIFQGNLLVSEARFQELYPEISGYRLFLIRTPSGQKDRVREVLDDRLGDWGFFAADARKRMEALQVVQNTYLQTFQSLGALGLLLGTFGLATVQLRSVLERRGELALMRAAGFRRGRLAGMVLLETAILLAGGLAIGVLAALVTVLPHMILGGAAVPLGTLAGMLTLVFAAGLLSGLAAVRATLRAPLIPALRGD